MASTIEILLTAIELADRLLWGPWTMIFIGGVAVYLSVRSGFYPIRAFPRILKETVGSLGRATETNRSNAVGQRMTPFQATATALASTVGTGNIAGVATALSIGGPGAIFWMWVLALLGMMTKTAEITLAVHFRSVKSDGSVSGGPMYYINKGLGWGPLAAVFSAGVLVNSMAAATLQSHTVGRAFVSSYNTNPYLVTSLMAFVTAIVVFGGLRRIGQVSETLVPIMSIVYILAGGFILIANFDTVPDVFRQILTHAFSPAPAVGGFAGAAVSQAMAVGMSRGMLSNEAGLGTAPMAHATAMTDHPFKQGMWGAFEVFIDTIVLCSITSFAVLSTGVLSGGSSGIELVIQGFASVFSPQIASALLSFSILTFCLSTQIAFYIYFETALRSLFGDRLLRFARPIYLVPGILFAGVENVDRLWVLANIAVGSCAIPNLVAVLVLSGSFFTLMRDYLSGEKRFATSITDGNTDNYVRTARLGGEA